MSSSRGGKFIQLTIVQSLSMVLKSTVNLKNKIGSSFFKSWFLSFSCSFFLRFIYLHWIFLFLHLHVRLIDLECASLDLEGPWLLHSPPFLKESVLSWCFQSVLFLYTIPAACVCILHPALDLGLLIFEPQAVIINLNLFQAKSNMITDAYLLFWVLKNRSAIKQLLSRTNLISKPARWWTVNSCSSFSCLLVSLLRLLVPSRTHDSAPALQTRMDDFTVLPGFPLWPRDLPLPSADISQQQRRTQLSGSLRSCITAQRARSNTRTRHTHLEKGSDTGSTAVPSATSLFALNPVLIPHTVGNHVWGAAIQRGENERLWDGQRGQPDVL